jgi:hypothetical protein
MDWVEFEFVDQRKDKSENLLSLHYVSISDQYVTEILRSNDRTEIHRLLKKRITLYY